MIILDILIDVFNIFLEMSPYILLGLFFVGLMNLFVTKDLIEKNIGKNNLASIIKAAIFGIPLPLCSCGVIPTAVYMSNNKASKPAVVSFLISTPQTGIDSILATYGMMGPLFAIYRPIAALIMGLFGGILTKNYYKEPEKKFFSLNVLNNKIEQDKKTFIDKFFKYPYFEFLDDIAPQFIVGIIIAGLISFFIPDDFFADSIFSQGILSMLIMIAIGVPMYICATASIPIAVALMLKGFSPGAAFVFLAVGPATNAASFTVLAKTLGKKIVSIYILSIIISSLVFGYLLNYFFSAFEIDPRDYIPMNHIHDHGIDNITIISGVVLGLLLTLSVYRIYLKKYFSKSKLPKDYNQIEIEGMTCSHCSDTITKTLSKFDNLSDIKVDHVSGTATFKGDFNIDNLSKSISEAGYSIKK